MARRTKKKPKGIAGFLIDAHIPDDTAEYLRSRNYRVERAPRGTPDSRVFQLAQREHMVLITQDSKIRRHISSNRHHDVVIIHGRDLRSEGVTSIVDNVLSLFKPIEDIAGLIIDISRYRLSLTFPGGTRDRQITL